MAKSYPVDIAYLPWQHKVFFESESRRRLVHKGRRLGFTRGAAQAVCEWLFDGTFARCMWGDTIASNIDKYMDRYFMPILKQLPEGCWQWKKQERMLVINERTCDFRSADRPENWEGFGYDLIILNEAGIILRNAYLWDNAVRPMLLDNPKSVAIIGGTPKGKRFKGEPHKYYELVCKAMQNPEHDVFHFTTYDNPLVGKSDIDEMVAEMTEEIVEQEINGKFMDIDDSVLISAIVIAAAIKRTIPFTAYRSMPKILGVDVGWSGDPTVCTLRQGDHSYPPIEIAPASDDMVMAARVAKVIQELKPDQVNIDYGYGTGVIAALQMMGFDVMGVKFGEAALDPIKYANRRAEMYDLCRLWLTANGSIPDHGKLKMDLSVIGHGVDDKDRLLLEKKDLIKKRLKRSPDYGDSLALTFAVPVTGMDSVVPEDQMTEAERDWAIITGQMQDGGNMAVIMDPTGDYD